MRLAALLLLVPCLLTPALAAKWPAIPKAAWAMKDDPAQVAEGAVILERKLDFQPFYFEETLRVRILSQAGTAAGGFTAMPPNLLLLEGQVTYPDGRVLPIAKAEDFLVRMLVSTVDGTRNEGVLIAPGITADCILDLRWREATVRGRAEYSRMSLVGKGTLPERCGDFQFWTLASAYPTRVCVLQYGKETFWPFLILGARGFDMTEGAGSMGKTFTFRNLPATPPASFSFEMNRPSPKVLVYRPVDWVSHLETKAPAAAYWKEVAELYYKDWFLKYVLKGPRYAAFSREVRKDLSGGPAARAKVIAGRIAQRMVNLDTPQYDEKPTYYASQGLETGLNSDLDHSAQWGQLNSLGAVRMLLHVLLDEGIKPKVAMVADRRKWVVNPEVRTPFQFTHTLLCVDDPEEETLWLDPAGRLVAPGEVPFYYQGTKALLLDASDFSMSFRDIRVASSHFNTRTFAYRMAVDTASAKVRLEVASLGAPALEARLALATKSPTQREAWFKEGLEQRGLTVAKVEVANALTATEPLRYTAEGSLVLEPGRLLKLNPFPGLDAGMYLPASLPEARRDPIVMPYLGVLEAHSTVKVPKGYVLVSPVSQERSTQWGTVTLDVTQDPGTGDLEAWMKVSTLSFYNPPAAYASLLEYLQAARAAVYPEITLEKAQEAAP